MRGTPDPPPAGGPPPRRPDPHGLSWRPPFATIREEPPAPPAVAPHWPREEDRGGDEEHEEEGSVSKDARKPRHRTGPTVAAALLVVAAASAVAAGARRTLSPRGGAAAPDGRRLRREPEYRDLLARMTASEYGSDETRERALAMAKTQWPNCVSQRLSAIQCKNYIDQEIVDLNTDADRFIRTIIVGKRKGNDPLSNSIVIDMDDHDLAIGRDGDGLVYYDFDWSGSGVEATSYQQRKIPPIIAEEITADITVESVEVNVVPVRILGATTDDAIAEYSTAPIYGGVQIVGDATNTPTGDATLAAALSEPVTIEAAGTRTLGPFDCTGLTGRNCCLMIKHKIRDADTNGRAVQCYLDYAEGTVKKQALINSRGRKVFIFENHKGRISKEPKVVGDWPPEATEGDFNTWIQEGGGLSNGQMRLIHGDDWVPPGQEA